MILRQIAQYYTLKNQLGRKANLVDFDVIREQIKGEFKKKIKITRKHNETRFEFEKTTNGLNIVFTKDTQIQHN